MDSSHHRRRTESNLAAKLNGDIRRCLCRGLVTSGIGNARPRWTRAAKAGAFRLSHRTGRRPRIHCRGHHPLRLPRFADHEAAPLSRDPAARPEPREPQGSSKRAKGNLHETPRAFGETRKRNRRPANRKAQKKRPARPGRILARKIIESEDLLGGGRRGSVITLRARGVF